MSKKGPKIAVLYNKSIQNAKYVTHQNERPNPQRSSYLCLCPWLLCSLPHSVIHFHSNWILSLHHRISNTKQCSRSTQNTQQNDDVNPLDSNIHGSTRLVTHLVHFNQRSPTKSWVKMVMCTVPCRCTQIHCMQFI